MTRAPKRYTRLTRSPLSVGSYQSLWLASDHLLQVDSNGYTEHYQRFQFSDIQGFFIGDSNRRLYWNLFWSMVAIVAALPFVYALLSEEVPGASIVFLGISTIFLLWNNLLGPSCRVYLVTKVQTLHLGALARRRKANKVLGRIQPLIERAQSSLHGSAARIPSVTAPPVPDGRPADVSMTGAAPETAPPVS